MKKYTWQGVLVARRLESEQGMDIAEVSTERLVWFVKQNWISTELRKRVKAELATRPPVMRQKITFPTAAELSRAQGDARLNKGCANRSGKHDD